MDILSYIWSRKLYLMSCNRADCLENTDLDRQFTLCNISYAANMIGTTAWIMHTMAQFTSQISTTNCMKDVFSTARNICGSVTMFICIFSGDLNSYASLHFGWL